MMSTFSLLILQTAGVLKILNSLLFFQKNLNCCSCLKTLKSFEFHLSQKLQLYP